MWTTLGAVGAVGAVGVLVTLCSDIGRVFGLWIALRGTLPADRPEIIRALNEGGSSSRRRRSVRANA